GVVGYHHQVVAHRDMARTEITCVPPRPGTHFLEHFCDGRGMALYVDTKPVVPDRGMEAETRSARGLCIKQLDRTHRQGASHVETLGHRLFPYNNIALLTLYYPTPRKSRNNFDPTLTSRNREQRETVRGVGRYRTIASYECSTDTRNPLTRPVPRAFPSPLRTAASSIGLSSTRPDA